MTSEDQLIELLHQKQVTAFQELFDRFYQYLVLYAMKWVERQEVAEDIVQDLFLKIWERDTEYSSWYGFKNFLYQSVKNAALDHLKHRVVEGKYIQYIKKFPDENSDPELETMKQEVYRRLYAVLEDLPKRCREVFTYHLEGKKNAEIAALLHISVLTVKAQKQTAMRYLEKRLGNLYLIMVLLKLI